MEEDQSPFKIELENVISQVKVFLKKPIFIGLSILFIISLASTYYILFMWNAKPSMSKTNSANFVLPSVPDVSPSLSPSFTPTPTASATPTPVSASDPTSKWSTFTNSVYRYSIKYPPGWVAGYINSTDPLIPNFVSINPSTASASLNSITISYTTRTAAQLAAIYGTSSATLTIATQSASEYDQQDSSGNKSVSIILEEPTYAYVFYAMDQYKTLLLQMLSTLILNP